MGSGLNSDVNDKPWVRWSLAIGFALLVQGLPCLPNSANQNFLRCARDVNLKAKTHSGNQHEACSGFMCAVAVPRLLTFADKATTDPVAMFTIVLAFSTIGLWRETQRLAADAKSQSVAMQKTLEQNWTMFSSSERPWVDVTAVEIIGPFTIVRNKGAGGGGTASTEVRIHLINKGKSPAKKVEINPVLWAWAGEEVALQAQERMRREMLIERQDDRPDSIPGDRGFDLFPGETVIREKNLTVVLEEFYLKNPLYEILGGVTYYSSYEEVPRFAGIVFILETASGFRFSGERLHIPAGGVKLRPENSRTFGN